MLARWHSFMLSALLLCSMLIGCGTVTSGISTTTTASNPTLKPGGITGIVHGGQQPVSSSHIYLYAVATNGYAQPAASLLSTGSNVQFDTNGNGYVASDSGGGFNITGDYNCPTSTSLIYVLALGGNPGLSAGTNNAAIALAAALGNCTTIKANAASTNVVINELTTVAAAYALAGFMTAPTQAGASSTNLTGITNAFATAALLANIGTGNTPLTTPSGNGILPQTELYTLADILATCVNSDGTTGCTPIFSPTTVNGVAPTNTLQVALNIAHNPGTVFGSLSNLIAPQPPFQPTFTSSPNDWTVAITYTGDGISTPQSIAVDAAGNAWVANAANTITELSAATGAPLSGTNGFSATGLDAPVSLAIDTTGDVWITNCGNPCSGSGQSSSVTVLASNGQTAGNYSSTGFNGSYAIALSGANEVWVANSLGSSLTKLNSSGSTAIASTIASDLIYPVSVAVNAGGNALTVSPADNAIVGFASSGAADTTDGYRGTALNFPYALAVDHVGNVWVANHGNNTVAVLNSGASVGNSPYSGGGITTPVAIALDGAGSAWVANTSGSLSEITNAGKVVSPSTGLRNDLIYPDAIAIDGSGNIWIASCGHYCQPSSNSSGSVSLVVGAAMPVTAPLSLAVATNRLASEP
jgi:streptogramin lyase